MYFRYLFASNSFYQRVENSNPTKGVQKYKFLMVGQSYMSHFVPVAECGVLSAVLAGTY